jgi:type II secretory ATPase GspE/PulE/Tfp pilus assembly ATPase PilB-like protein
MTSITSRISVRPFPRICSFTVAAACDHCRQTGYRGRTAIYELCLVTEGLRRLVIRKGTAAS